MHLFGFLQPRITMHGTTNIKFSVKSVGLVEVLYQEACLANRSHVNRM